MIICLNICKIFAIAITEKPRKSRQMRRRRKQKLGPSVLPPTTPNVKQNQSSAAANEGPSAKDLTPESIGTPVSSKMVDDQGEAIDSSPAMSTISAGSATPSLPRGRGRPHKLVTKPDFSDFPVDGSYEDQERWFKAKRTKIWCYNMLSSNQEAAYRAREKLENIKALP